MKRLICLFTALGCFACADSLTPSSQNREENLQASSVGDNNSFLFAEGNSSSRVQVNGSAQVNGSTVQVSVYTPVSINGKTMHIFFASTAAIPTGITTPVAFYNYLQVNPNLGHVKSATVNGYTAQVQFPNGVFTAYAMVKSGQIFFTQLLQISVPNNSSGALSYPIVYVAVPRPGGDLQASHLPDFGDPSEIEPGSKLMLRLANGTKQVFYDPGPNGAVLDPVVSFDGQKVFFAATSNASYAYGVDRKSQVPAKLALLSGTDIYVKDVPTGVVTRLTFQEWEPNTGSGNWSANPTGQGASSGQNYPGYGVYNMGPCLVSGGPNKPQGRIVFTSSRKGYAPNKRSTTILPMQLYVMDTDGKNVQAIGPMNLGGALHPVVMLDGRVMFASSEGQGMRDDRLWGIWAINPDGRNWGPLYSAFIDSLGWHWPAQNSAGDIFAVLYYHYNNFGAGSLWKSNPVPPVGLPPFGSLYNNLNPSFLHGYSDKTGPAPYTPQAIHLRMAFTPYEMENMAPLMHGRDEAGFASSSSAAAFVGKLRDPTGAPNNDLLVIYSGASPTSTTGRPTNLPYPNMGIYLIQDSQIINNPSALIPIEDDPNVNEIMPRALVPYSQIYGVSEPAYIPFLPNDGSIDANIPEGSPFGLVGTSSFMKRDTAPGLGDPNFPGDPLNQLRGLEAFNGDDNANNGLQWASGNPVSSWLVQGSDAGKYSDQDIWAVRIVGMVPVSARNAGNNGYVFNQFSGVNFESFLVTSSEPTGERLRNLGEIPLRKFNTSGTPILDIEGNPDTSFLAKIPADVPFTFQTLDKNGMVLNMAQTWHQVRPGEKRVDCGGCHAHSQVGLDFNSTAAAQSNYPLWDLTQATIPLLTKDFQGQTIVAQQNAAPVREIEFYRDIQPVLQRSCVGCHTGANAAAQLELDSDGAQYDKAWRRLCNDESGSHGIPPVRPQGFWEKPNASRYVRKFQSRRSLLMWKLYGQRLDGWTNAHFPTESVAGNPNTLPAGANPYHADLDYTGTIMPPPGSGYQALSADEKMDFARWIDLGCVININHASRSAFGAFLDDWRPTLAVTWPRAEHHTAPLTRILISVTDYYSGVNMASLSVKANFSVNGQAAGTELSSFLLPLGDSRYQINLSPPVSQQSNLALTVSVKDNQGNITKVARSFSVQ